MHWKHEGETSRFVLPQEGFPDSTRLCPFLEALRPTLGEFRQDAPTDAVCVAGPLSPALHVSGDFAINEGAWEDYYGVTLELHDAETGALLLRRTYLLDGWQH